MTIKPAYELLDKPKLLIVDGAGTLFDPGSKVPVYGFQRGFNEYTHENDKFDFEPKFDLVMKYMGRNKLEHIKLLLEESNVHNAFVKRFDREPTEKDVQGIYTSFKEQLYPAASKTEEILGVKEAAYRLKNEGIPLIMTTGYDRRMVNETKKKLPWLDDVLMRDFTSSDVKKGRPSPEMIHKAMKHVNIDDPTYVVKIGDTKVDIEAADNACMPSIVVTSGSIPDVETAKAINEEIGRKHLVVPSLVDVIEFTLDGTLVDRIRNLNK